MLKLFKIMQRFSAPKDNVEFVFKYVLAENEEIVFRHIDILANWTMCDEGEMFDVYDGYQLVIQESLTEKLMRLRGDINDEDFELEDLDYGVTQWGWDEGSEISVDDSATLVRLNLAEVWN